MKFCGKCGAKMDDLQKFCGNCGAESMQNITADTNTNTGSNETATVSEPMPSNSDVTQNINMTPVPRENAAVPQYVPYSAARCPNCGSNQLQPLSETTTTATVTSKGYSSASGCLGFLIFGPFGLLCGECGNSQKTSIDSKVRTYWVCSQCGNKFRNVFDWRRQIDEEKKSLDTKAKEVFPALIVSIILFLGGLAGDNGICLIIGFFGSIGLAMEAFKLCVSIYNNKNENMECSELEKRLPR